MRSAWTKETRAFVAGALGYLMFRHRLFQRTHRPQAGHRVPDDFVGICVATGADPGVDAYLLERLRELGIDQVRLDYGYQSPDGHADRLLNVLLDQSFRVLLHLVQSRAVAAAMAEDDRQREWRRFVETVLDRYGDRIVALEVGSTVNRHRWAGYTLQGFAQAWRVAFDAARSRGVTIAGPNITDFEPLYAAGLLRVMRRAGRPPDVYTNNLFVERVIEPEAFDHRVAGRPWARLLALNLIKKARQMRQLASRNGVARYWNGYVTWTHPRIFRRLPNVEDKQADYLTRYLVLAAAANAQDRVYWGPLVSSREGLIDDPRNPNPLEELVTFYGTVHGPPSCFRRRPAYHALRHFQAVIPGSRYLGRLVAADGLEVHGFETAQWLTHVVWTANARAARLDDVYRPADLNRARWCGLTGGPLPESPQLATETPRYLSWPAGTHVEVNAAAAPIPGLAVALHGVAGSYYPFRSGGWQGVVVARDAAHAEALLAALHPDRLAALPRLGLLRRGRNEIWTISDPTGERRILTVKQPVRLRPHKRLIERFRPSKGIRSFSGACQLLRRGIASPQPVAYFERRDGSGPTDNYYVCEYQPEALSVRDCFTAYGAGAPQVEGWSLDEFLAHLVPFLVNLHDRGVYFRDLSGGNVLVLRGEGTGPAFSLVDTARARFADDGIGIFQRLSDLKRVCHKLHWTGRVRLLERYLRAIGRGFSLPYRIPFYLYDLKAAAKRRLRRPGSG